MIVTKNLDLSVFWKHSKKSFSFFDPAIKRPGHARSSPLHRSKINKKMKELLEIDPLGATHRLGKKVVTNQVPKKEWSVKRINKSNIENI